MKLFEIKDWGKQGFTTSNNDGVGTGNGVMSFAKTGIRYNWIFIYIFLFYLESKQKYQIKSKKQTYLSNQDFRWQKKVDGINEWLIELLIVLKWMLD